MERLATLFPVGPEDELEHRGARRRAARYPVHADVRVTGPTEATGVVLNASAGGLRVALQGASEQAWGEGDRLELEVEIDDQVTRDDAEVVWSRQLPDGWLVGLRFLRSASRA
ncbi:MAG TPA: PilZ domain-containing protein [Sandaracinaceae bacterium LLY-WYZ-13_1]|nr:PilZ domain-containing protein [Sandaracinaceae bacterium LLY-WYZ-13_1]